VDSGQWTLVDVKWTEVDISGPTGRVSCMPWLASSGLWTEVDISGPTGRVSCMPWLAG